MKTFQDLGLSSPILRALDDCGYEEPTPIQQKAIPIVMGHHNLIATAQTGTGKTAAFMLPIIDDIAQRPSGKGDDPLCLVLTPTRELAQQIEENTRDYGKYVDTRTVVVVGGVSSQPQVDRIRKGVDVIIATPGRLIDLMKQGAVTLGDVDFLVLDEADRMLDMGFVHDVHWICDHVPRPRQTLLFSATMSGPVKSLASMLQTNAQSVSVAPPATVADNIEQRVAFVRKGNKRELLLDLIADEDSDRVLVFTGTKQSAAAVSRFLEVAGVKAEAIHSNRTQSQRQRALERFTKGSVKVLIATDIVARGIDVEGITHVINYDVPEDAENYVHRIGRTARAGRAGIAVSLCCVEDVSHLRGVQRLVKEPIVTWKDHDWHSDRVEACLAAATQAAKQRAKAGRMRGSGSKWAR